MVIAMRTLESGFPQSNEGPFADRTHAVTENKIITQTNSTAAWYRGGEREISVGGHADGECLQPLGWFKEDVGVPVLLSLVSSYVSVVQVKQSPASV